MSKVETLIKEIKDAGWLYSWLKMEDFDYDGSCPCFYYERDGIILNCTCWRTGDFEFSGLKVSCDDALVPHSDLEALTFLCLHDITQVWKNTDWEYQINENDKIKYEIKS